ncbi:cytochrome P450 [Arthrobacter sp. EH-1B-1]|uniref:Cytochrome P450 n=1 Tax=Arthrobacter vasquezii TaxID=2977629 RepID=A0ABT6CZ86_9MICC|nr:cytochrome P450 [Arthrobacter vasquezii]MDF9279386.1 cytochrome P450 [Arthrobacter vasquezii]
MSSVESLPQLTVRETATFLSKVFVPTLAKGPIIRRPRMVALAEKLHLDERAVATLTQLAAKYPASPVLLRLPLRRQAIVLEPRDVHRILAETPEPFAAASSEKKAALSHFQPRNSLISSGRERSVRRALQDQVLDSGSPVHRLAESFLPIVAEEAEDLLRVVRRSGALTWDEFIQSWYRMVRRVVFGDAAAHDEELTDMLAQLRADGNWAFLKPRKRKLRAQFLAAVGHRMQAAPQGSLASVMSGMNPQDSTAPVEQIPQWLFAFDPAGMATFRALAAVAAHPEVRARALREVAENRSRREYLPWLRACVLESLRLWPTTPMVLRQSTGEVSWEAGTMPAKCGVLIYAPFFHRDRRTVPQPDAYTPERWLNNDDDGDWALIPFSEGPAACPGRHLVLMLTSAFLAHVLDGPELQLESAKRLNVGGPLPGTLDNYSLRFTTAPAYR